MLKPIQALASHVPGRILGGLSRGLLLAALALPAALQASPLLDAAQAGNAGAALALLEEDSAAVNVTSSNGTSALHWAAYHDDLALVEALLAAGANPNVSNDYGSSPVSEAAVNGNAQILAALLDAGADVESPNGEGQTALMVVARSNQVEAARVLLEHGADPNARERWRNQTALIWAAAQSQPEMVALLLEHGANPDAQTEINRWERQISAEPRFMWRPMGGFTALIYAAREGCLECARHLVAGGASLDLADGESRTPLLLAIVNMHFDLAAHLIEAGANVNKWDLWGDQPLYAAVDVNTLPAGGYPDRPSTDDTSALDVIDMLLARGANPNAQLKLMLHHRHITDDRGADPILDIGATPLLRAAKAFDLPVVERLLAHGAIVDLPNVQGVTPLMATAGLGVTHVDTRGNHAASNAQARALEVVEVLLEAGADVNRTDKLGYTALHGAAFWGFSRVVERLEEAGADPMLESLEGHTALDVAEGRVVMGIGRGAASANRPETADLLRQLMSAADLRSP